MTDKYWLRAKFSCLRQKNERGFYQASEQYSIKYLTAAYFK